MHVEHALCQTDHLVMRCTFIESTRALLSCGWEVEIKLVMREMNKVKDWFLRKVEVSNWRNGVHNAFIRGGSSVKENL
ncbi:hypothetical protein V6N12_028531 [Hibiscus sabdariffa]|uniref:Uncharacterized protein n=1 Tax=Hibiscus sabdariffa TaxID=183260 RepID=A0ABR2F642_9ROSI